MVPGIIWPQARLLPYIGVLLWTLAMLRATLVISASFDTLLSAERVASDPTVKTEDAVGTECHEQAHS